VFQDAPAVLPEIVVTAARLPPAAGEAAFSVIRLDRKALEGTQRLDEVLSATPAVSLFRRTSSLAANPTTQGLSLRAIAPSGAGRALVTLDGAPLNDPFGGWVIWSQVAPEALSGLDIIRGAGSGPYGAGALTGVVALRERSGTGGVLDLSGGETGGRRLAASVGLGQGRVLFTASLLGEQSDGYVPVRGPARGAADTPLDLMTRGAALRADIALDEAASISLRASAYDEDRGSGLLGARSSATGHALSLTAARTPGPGRTGWRVQGWRRESDLSNSSVAVAANRGSTTPANDQFATPAAGWGGNAALRRSGVALAGGQFEWELGADARYNRGETRERFRFIAGSFTRDRIAGGETSTVGAYLEGAWASGPWLVAGGLRLDRWDNTDGQRTETDRTTGAITLDEADVDRSGEVASARLGLRRDLGQGWAARATVYSGFRPATLNELHRPFRVGNDLTEANAALEPETLKGIEGALSWDGETASLGATVFANQIEEAIVNVTIGTGPGTFPRAGFVPAGGVLRQRRNAGTIDATGVELNAEWRLDGLTLSGAASWTQAEVDGGLSAPQLTGLRPAQAPRWSATAGAQWQVTPRLSLDGRVRHESVRFDDDLNRRTLAAASLVEGRLEWQAIDGVSLYLAGDNLADADVAVSVTGDGVEGLALPRTLRMGVTLTW